MSIDWPESALLRNEKKSKGKIVYEFHLTESPQEILSHFLYQQVIAGGSLFLADNRSRIEGEVKIHMKNGKLMKTSGGHGFLKPEEEISKEQFEYLLKVLAQFNRPSGKFGYGTLEIHNPST